MMAGKNYDIATTIKLNGEKEFDKALGDANRSMRVMDSELKKLEAAFDAGGTEMDYFTGKADALGREYKQQEAIVDALRRAVEEQSQAYGEASAEVQKYQIRLNNAEAKLSKLAKASETANRELEDLGRDSNKIGRQIENGIGDAAENVSEKLDGMFAKVSADVNALKGSVAFQTAMDVGGFVMDGIQAVMGFVEENDEYNRQIAIARHNVERYGHDWDEAMKLIVDATVITGNRDGAFEAISNLHSTAVEDQQLIEAAADALLGVFITTGGALSFESLAEDFRASVVSRVPTGTYAEVLEELLQDVVIEDVEKALGKAESVEDAFNIALSYLTKGGYQSTTKSLEEQNAELFETQRKQQELANAWAELALEATPIVSAVVDLTTEAVGMLTEMVKNLKGNVNELQEILNSPEGTIQNPDWHKENLQEDYPEFSEALENGTLDSWEGTLDFMRKNLFPSAGAEELTTPETQTNFEDAGSMAWTAYTSGILSAAAENPAMQAVLDAEMAKIAEENDAAFTAGSNAMISFANGIADGSVVVMNNVNTLVNQINKALASIAMPAYGYGLGGITGGSMYIGRETLTETVSMGMKVRMDTKNYLK